MGSNEQVKDQLKNLVKERINQLALSADVCVFSLYDPDYADEGPIRKQIFEPSNTDDMAALPDSLEFDGIGVWYICWRHGDTFTVRHILLKSENGKFVHQQTNTFEGYWEDWPRYVADDKWVHAHILKNKPTRKQAIA